MKKILIGFGFIMLVILLIFLITFFNNKNKSESILIDVYSSWLPSLSVPGVENKEIMIKNNTSKEYKSISIKVRCKTDKNENVTGLYEKDNLKSNETINDKVIINTLFASGKIKTCTTNYNVEEYNFFEWIMHYIEKK